MDARTRAELAQALRRKRTAALKHFFDTEADLQAIADDREPELEERAQAERTARILAGLDDRSVHEIADVHAALRRIIGGTYGTCLDCGAAIPVSRLRAVPTTAFCVECAREEETARPGARATVEPQHPPKAAGRRSPPAARSRTAGSGMRRRERRP